MSREEIKQVLAGHLGSASAIARDLGVSRDAVSSWLSGKVAKSPAISEACRRMAVAYQRIDGELAANRRALKARKK